MAQHYVMHYVLDDIMDYVMHTGRQAGGLVKTIQQGKLLPLYTCMCVHACTHTCISF